MSSVDDVILLINKHQDVLDRIMKEKDSRDIKSTMLSQSLWSLKQNRARHQSPHARFMKPMCSMINPGKSQMVVYVSRSFLDTEDQDSNVKAAAISTLGYF
jgi:hypothetical protein